MSEIESCGGSGLIRVTAHAHYGEATICPGCADCADETAALTPDGVVRSDDSARWTP